MEVQLLAGHSDLRMNVGDHVLENGEVVTFPFMDLPQTFPLSSWFIKTRTLHGELRDW